MLMQTKCTDIDTDIFVNWN